MNSSWQTSQGSPWLPLSQRELKAFLMETTGFGPTAHVGGSCWKDSQVLSTLLVFLSTRAPCPAFFMDWSGVRTRVGVIRRLACLLWGLETRDWASGHVHAFFPRTSPPPRPPWKDLLFTAHYTGRPQDRDPGVYTDAQQF